MENIMTVILNNGLGFASFIALIYFYLYFLKDMKTTNEEILKNLVSLNTSLTLMNNRIERLENERVKD